MNKIYKITISLLFGLIGLYANFHTFIFPFGEYTAAILFGLLFPILITLSWGWKYGLLSALFGGCQTMWWLWGPSNGYAIFFVVPPFTFWVVWHGIFAKLRNKQKTHKWWLSMYVVEIPFRILCSINLLTLSRWAVSLNPPSWSWCSNAPNTIPMHFSIFVAIKQASVGFVILLLADVLLNIKYVRRFMKLKENRDYRKTGHILSAFLLLGCCFWLLDSIFYSFVFHTDRSFIDMFALNIPDYNMFIRTVFFFGSLTCGLITSGILRRQKEGEIAIRMSEAKLATTLNSIGDAVIGTDCDGLITRMNPVAEQLTGWAFSDANGHPLDEVFDIMNQHTRQKVENPVERVLREGVTVGLANHTVLISRSGVEYFISDSGAPIRNGNNEIEGIVLVFRDITEQYLAEKEREKLLRALGERVKELNCLYGISSLVEEPEATLEGIIQGTVDLILASWQYPDETCVRIMINDSEFKTSNYEEGKWKQTSEIIVKSIPVGLAEVFHLDQMDECDENPLQNEEQVLLDAITERLGKIIERFQAEEAVRESEAKLATTLNSIGDAVIGTDCDGLITRMNPVAEQLTGWAFSDANGHPLDEVFDIMNQHTRQKVENPVERVLREGVTVGLANHTVLISRSGVEYFISDSGAPIRNGNNEIEGVVLVFRDITEKYKAEEIIQQQNEFLNNVIESLTYPFYVINTDNYEIVMGNSASGFHSALKNKTCYNITHKNEEPCRGQECPCPLEIVKQTHKPALIEHIHFDRFGNRRDVEVHCYPIIGRNGDVVQIIEFCIDITERKQAEKALLESEARYRGVVEDTPVLICRFLPDGEIIFANEAYCRYFDNTCEELVGKTFLSKIPEANQKTVMDNISAITIESPTQTHEHPVIIAGNEIRWQRWTNRALFDVQGKVVAFQSVGEDITEHKQAVENLRESKEQYRILVENANDAIFVLQDDFIKFANPKTQELLGYTASELKSLPITDLIHPDNTETAAAELAKRTNSDKQNIVITIKMINKLRLKLMVQIRSTQIQWEQRPATLNFAIDITEQLELESRLRQAQKMEAIGTLAGGIAHDFNNVIFSMLGFTEMAMEDIEKDTEAYDNLQEVLNTTLHAKDMIQQILAFSRQTDAKKWPVEIKSIIKEVLKLLRSFIPATIEIRHDLSGADSPVLADATQIHQVIMNLATNAYHAMRGTGGVLELKLSEVDIGTDELVLDLSPGRYMKILLSDTGHGIDSDVIDKIFDPYFTTKPPGEGTGMGLAVAHGIIKDHEGDIFVYSKPHQGTVFHVYLPVLESEVVEPEAQEEEVIPCGNERILLVDDNEKVNTMAHRLLQRLGYCVSSFSNGKSALAAFKANPDDFDLVITDMTMPKLTGVELTLMIREIRPEIPVILCTGFSEHIDEKKADSIGISAYIMKPIGKSVVANTVRDVLDRKKQ